MIILLKAFLFLLFIFVGWLNARHFNNKDAIIVYIIDTYDTEFLPAIAENRKRIAAIFQLPSLKNKGAK